MWCHASRNILNCNRITHLEPVIPEGAEDVDPEEEKKKMEAADPFEMRLKSISQDATIQGGLPAWVVRSHGDSTSFASAN